MKVDNDTLNRFENKRDEIEQAGDLAAAIDYDDQGDWDDEKLVECNTMEDLRLKAVEWCDSFPVNNEL